ncbi:EAL domain-containing protein [Sulfuricurvum sp.]|uniref:EAL domain-containing protein n=1 Tax=Sulfuricurvum sp. TaxID=2025608 RepID=UPI0026390CC5|nr:EAL domain-containing protein [Sulfuricurvum sp.]MDD2266695.1 EAL domain-containing protein [Sulfuricurvum sp.]MDD2784143.1 EAL domain-containing protein [Sulfuricurvum sp.]
MSCDKCQTLPSLPKKGGDLIISCDVQEMADKMKSYLDQKTINYQIEDPQTLWIHVDGFTLFLRELCETQTFSKIERNAIHLLFLENGETLSPSKLRMMKTLQQYKDLAGAEYLSSLITKGALTTHFQPIVDLATDTIYGYESLARGVSEDGTLIYPDRLFQWGREGDMLFYLDRACRESSLKTAAVKHIASKVFINFIPTAIYDPEHCLQSTVKWAKELDFDPKNIIFEVIESDHVDDLEHLKKILAFYRSQGFLVALDDVGSGYASLNMIAKLRPDIVKIDREIIDYIDTNEVNQSIFRAIVTIAKENGILVLAEGVERLEEAAFCAKEGADLAQGYYYGKPSAEPIRRL